MKRTKTSRPAAAAAFGLIALASLAAHAQGGGVRMYQRQLSLGGRIPATILLVGNVSDAQSIEKLFDVVSEKASNAAADLDWRNASGAVAKLNAQAGQGGVEVSEDVLAAFEAAVKVSGWTGGAFDITYAGGGSWRDLKISEGARRIELKKSGMQVRFDPIIDGFLAELISRYLYAANMQNHIVKVGSVFRGVGGNVTGPWKVQVEDDAGTFAHHALNLTVANSGVAAVSASQFRSEPAIDPRSKSAGTQTCRGVVVVMGDAAHAEGIAQAVYILGPVEGMKLLQKYAKGLIVDNEGKFLRTPGF